MSFASSCSIDNQVPLTVDLDVEISQSDTKMILPAGGIDATKITVYKLSGKGPNGETFNWRSSTNGKFKVFGISQGYWVLTAEGYSANGTKIANGTANVYLNDANTKVSIILNTLSGNGTAQVTVRWNTKLVPSSAYLELQLKPINGSYVKKSFKSNSNGVAVWEENLPAGSYVVSVMLYETNAKTKVVGGTKDALRVVADNLSSGDITLTIGEVVDLTSSVVDNFGEPITISLTPANNTAATIGFSTILKSTLTKPVSGVTYKWYEDGVLIANANAANYTYAPTTVGRHTLTVVAKAPYVDQVGSASTIIIAIKSGYDIQPGQIIDFTDLSAPLAQDQICVGYYVDNSSKAVKSWKDSVDFPYKNTGSSNVTLLPIIVPMNSVLKNTTSSGKTTINSDANAPYSFINATIYADTTLRYLELPEGISRISANSFNGSKLKGIKVPTSLEVLGSSSFEDCVLLQTIDLSLSKITTIGSYSFSNCIALSSIIIPNSVTTIGSFAFYRCFSLSSITIPNNVTTIGNYAFLNCTAPSSITIPNSVTTIGYYAFSNWTSSQTIYIRASSKPAGWHADWDTSCNAKIVWGDSVTLINKIVYANYNKNEKVAAIDWGGNTGTVEYKTTDGQNGGYSKILKPITEGSGGIYQDVRTNLKPPAGTKYYASCYLKASATPGATSGYNLSFNSAESNTYYPYSGVRWGVNEWVKNSFVFTVSKNNETLQERSIIYSHNAGISFMYSNYVLIDLSRTTSKNGKPFLEILADSGYKIDEEIAKYLDNLPYFKDEYVLGCG